VNLLLPTGQSVVIQAQSIERVEPAVPADARGLPAPGGGTVVVHLEGPRPVVLETRGPGDRWKSVCTMPCDVSVPLDGEYRIAGDGMRATQPLMLAGTPGQRLVLRVTDVGSKSGYTGGVVLVAAGPALIVSGLVVLITGALGNCPTISDGPGFCDRHSYAGEEAAGVAVGVAGIGVLVGGIVLLASNSHSKVSSPMAGPLEHPAPHPDTAWLRTPVWIGAARDASALSAKMTTVPLFSHAF
jgi:hypothetical protein